VPDETADRLRERAERNHRSLQGELRVILEEAVSGREGQLDARGLYERAKTRGRVRTGESIVSVIRRMRDERTDHLVGVVEGRTTGRTKK
jgi:plasmid stability protein